MNDLLGREITVGDRIAYGGRRGSHGVMSVADVVSIGQRTVSALGDASTATDPRQIVQAVADGLKSLADTFGHLNAKQSLRSTRRPLRLARR